MNIKIKIHFMPWEIDYAMLTFQQLKKASYFLDNKDKIYIDSALNLSSYLIDWNSSKLGKDYFKRKYEIVSQYLDFATHKPFVYEGDELWGHLDLERTQVQDNIDYYMSICPDIYFHPSTLAYLIEGAKKVKHSYFVITPQTTKLWDDTWDVLVNPGFIDEPYSDWNKVDAYDRIVAIDGNDNDPAIEPLKVFKYAGWFDLYSKAYIEDLHPVPEGWKGYGPWDTFSMFASELASRKGLPVQQYILENHVITDLTSGPYRDNNPSTLYRELLVRKNISDQRMVIENRFDSDLKLWYDNFNSKR